MTTIARDRTASQPLTAATTAADEQIVGGVDTHRDTHTAAAVDRYGQLLGHQQFDATAAGYRQLLRWLRSFGQLTMVGVEGTSSYGTALTAHLLDQQVPVVEVDRPDRSTRRRVGKSDPIDAEAAARAALADVRTSTAKHHDGPVESIRVLRVARRTAVQHRADALRQLRTLIVTAPDPLRAVLRGLTLRRLLNTCAGLRPDLTRLRDPEQATKLALKDLARRHAALTVEIADLDKHLDVLVADANPGLIDLYGVGTDVAGQLLVTAGQNPHRISSDAAFAMLCGAAPIPASSGRTHRHRLNRGGDRQANAALHRVVVVRMKRHGPTRAYVERRTTEGLSKKDIMRCLKRAVAREVFHQLTKPSSTP